VINTEDFQQLVSDLEAGVEPSVSVADLVATIRALDVQLLIAQNALELSIANLNIAVSDTAQQVLAACGRTDNKTKKKMAELAAGMVNKCEGSVQTYLAKAFIEAAENLGVSWPSDADLLTEEEIPVIEAGDPWAPHNHD
jgi:hypothetical protein